MYLSDFHVGQSFSTGSVGVDEGEIIRFAERYDPQPFHTDPEAAKDSLFAGLAASGWMTIGLTMRLLVTEGLPIAGGIIGRGVEKLAWSRPVRPGDHLRTVTEVMEVLPPRPQSDRGTVIFRVETFNQKDELVLSMTTRNVVPSRTPADD